MDTCFGASTAGNTFYISTVTEKNLVRIILVFRGDFIFWVKSPLTNALLGKIFKKTCACDISVTIGRYDSGMMDNADCGGIELWNKMKTDGKKSRKS